RAQVAAQQCVVEIGRQHVVVEMLSARLVVRLASGRQRDRGGKEFATLGTQRILRAQRLGGIDGKQGAAEQEDKACVHFFQSNPVRVKAKPVSAVHRR